MLPYRLVRTQMYDDILLPTDGSAGMQKVIEHAASLAEKHDSKLHALYAVNTDSLTDIGVESSWDSINQALEQEGKGALNEVETLANHVSVETNLTEGPPAKEITGYAERSDCDVIVMGTHGRSGVNRLLLGSVAERVVRSSTVPVLTIRVANESET